MSSTLPLSSLPPHLSRCLAHAVTFHFRALLSLHLSRVSTRIHLDARLLPLRLLPTVVGDVTHGEEHCDDDDDATGDDEREDNGE
jgi:hypothetical protein